MIRILAINPGSTSTKGAVYEDHTAVAEFTIRHTADELSGYGLVTDQLDFRTDLILSELNARNIDPAGIDAVIGRGGLVKPVPSGVYRVNEALLGQLKEGRYGMHASNLGAMIAGRIAALSGAPAYIADPVVVDEMEDVARVTGLPGIERRSVFHALNQKAVARGYADRIGTAYEELNLIVAHLGGGISVGAHRKGRVVDVNNALDGDGPLAPERAGSIPACSMADLALGGRYDRPAISKLLAGRGGLTAHLGTNNVREALDRAAAGDAKAELVVGAMCYNISKSIGAMATVLRGKVDAVILTGGIAYNEEICTMIRESCGFIAPVEVIPGENELEALAANAYDAFMELRPVLVYE